MTIAVRPPAEVLVTFTGQSMNITPIAPLDVPLMTMARLGLTTWRNIAIGGNGWGDLLANSTHLTNLRAGARNLPGGTDILVMNGGQDDFFEGNSGATSYARAETYAALARSYGYDYVIGVTLPAFGPGPLYGITQAMVDAKDANNALMVADDPYPSGPFDALADGATLSDPNDVRYFFLDDLHLRVRGGQVLAQQIAGAALTLPPFA